MRTHGELTEDGCGRFCGVCGHEHGALYPCRHYPRWITNEIEAHTARWRQRLRECMSRGVRAPESVTHASFCGVYTPPWPPDPAA